MNVDDLASMTPAELLALKVALDERLDLARQQQIEAAVALGLTVVNGRAKRKRKSAKQHDAD